MLQLYIIKPCWPSACNQTRLRNHDSSGKVCVIVAGFKSASVGSSTTLGFCSFLLRKPLHRAWWLTHWQERATEPFSTSTEAAKTAGCEKLSSGCSTVVAKLWNMIILSWGYPILSNILGIITIHEIMLFFTPGWKLELDGVFRKPITLNHVES